MYNSTSQTDKNHGYTSLNIWILSTSHLSACKGGTNVELLESQSAIFVSHSVALFHRMLLLELIIVIIIFNLVRK